MHSWVSLGLSSLVWFGGLCCGQVVDTIGARAAYEYRQASRDGIGKHYFGREIARVMGHEGADWLERPEREAEERAALLLESLRFKSGETVADLGAGTGYFTRRIARQVAPGGRVYAVDIQPEMLVLLTNQLSSLGISNVVPILGTEQDPRLPGGALDTVLMVDVYHEFEFPREMMEAICRALKTGGRLVLVEFRAEDDAVPIKPLHKMSEAQVKREMSPWPLEWVETIRTLPRQHIMIFRKRAIEQSGLLRSNPARSGSS